MAEDDDYTPTLELGRWYILDENQPHQVWGICACCFQFKEAFRLTLCILPFGQGEEWRCDTCPGTRVRTN